MIKNLRYSLALTSALVAGLAPASYAQVMINFEDAPAFPATVNANQNLYPGFTMFGNGWVFGQVSNGAFNLINTSGPSGSVQTLNNFPLTFSFAAPVTGVSIDIGSGTTTTITYTISTSLGGSPVSSGDFTTVSTGLGATELHVHVPGIFDSLALTPLGGAVSTASAVVDNLSYTAVPEPSEIAAVAGLSLVGFAFIRRRMKKA
jgi:hypothetical protein